MTSSLTLPPFLAAVKSEKMGKRAGNRRKQGQRHWQKTALLRRHHHMQATLNQALFCQNPLYMTDTEQITSSFLIFDEKQPFVFSLSKLRACRQSYKSTNATRGPYSRIQWSRKFLEQLEIALSVQNQHKHVRPSEKVMF